MLRAVFFPLARLLRTYPPHPQFARGCCCRSSPARSCRACLAPRSAYTARIACPPPSSPPSQVAMSAACYWKAILNTLHHTTPGQALMATRLLLSAWLRVLSWACLLGIQAQSYEPAALGPVPVPSIRLGRPQDIFRPAITDAAGVLRLPGASFRALPWPLVLSGASVSLSGRCVAACLPLGVLSARGSLGRGALSLCPPLFVRASASRRLSSWPLPCFHAGPLSGSQAPFALPTPLFLRACYWPPPWLGWILRAFTFRGLRRRGLLPVLPVGLVAHGSCSR